MRERKRSILFSDNGVDHALSTCTCILSLILELYKKCLWGWETVFISCGTGDKAGAEQRLWKTRWCRVDYDYETMGQFHSVAEWLCKWPNQRTWACCGFYKAPKTIHEFLTTFTSDWGANERSFCSRVQSRQNKHLRNCLVWILRDIGFYCETGSMIYTCVVSRDVMCFRKGHSSLYSEWVERYGTAGLNGIKNDNK